MKSRKCPTHGELMEWIDCEECQGTGQGDALVTGRCRRCHGDGGVPWCEACELDERDRIDAEFCPTCREELPNLRNRIEAIEAERNRLEAEASKAKQLNTRLGERIAQLENWLRISDEREAAAIKQRELDRAVVVAALEFVEFSERDESAGAWRHSDIAMKIHDSAVEAGHLRNKD